MGMVVPTAVAVAPVAYLSAEQAATLAAEGMEPKGAAARVVEV